MDPLRLDDEAIFHVARRIEEPEARAAYLARACGEDRDLRGAVEVLLSAYDRDRSFLESPPVGFDLGATRAWSAPIEGPGAVVGPYRLMESIGEGGMGVVYVAEQHRPVRRKVALKVIKPGMDSKQVIARFEAERQALALMDHPNIARVLDAGATESGRPYFVMELVRGAPITEYCDEQQLTIRDRLELFVLVCRAVQHAHQKGIIHRDIKPSNVLITLHDGVPVPKIIDFGVAKATGQALTDKTIYTALTQIVGTPLYMSPEQVELSGLDVDTRSDIYSLGVLLYELLTGTTPFDGEALRKAAFDEMRRIIREQEPPRPSTRLSSLGDTLTGVSERRGADPRRLDRAVRGELDWIAMKALEKDRRRRYETANDFAADVMRYLTDRPVEACPPSGLYRLGKFARRNRAAITTTALVAAALVAGTGASLWQAARATRAEAKAEDRAEEARLIVDYLVRDVFGAAAPEKSHGRTVTVNDLLAMGDGAIPARFGRRPLAEASARQALGEALDALGRYDEAERQLRRVAALRAEHLGPDHPETLAAEALVVRTLCPAGVSLPTKPAEAEPIARRVLEASRRVLGPSHPRTLASMTALAHVLMIKLNQALNAEAVRYPSGMMPDHVMKSRGAASMGVARGLLERAYAGQVRRLGPEDPETLETLYTLGCVLYHVADFAGAEDVLRRAAEGRRRALGPLHPATLQGLKILGRTLLRMRRTDEANRLMIEVAEGHRQTFGPNHIQTSSALNALLLSLRRAGDAAAIRDLCERWLREILASPIDPDPYQRGRRSIRLSTLALELATLPEPIPSDAALAIRAAEEAAELGDLRDNNWTRLGLIYLRAGDPDRAARATRTSMDRRDGGDRFDWMVQAILHARRGEMDRARAWYDRATHAKDDPEARHVGIEYARAEAEALIDPKPPRR